MRPLFGKYSKRLGLKRRMRGSSGTYNAPAPSAQTFTGSPLSVAFATMGIAFASGSFTPAPTHTGNPTSFSFDAFTVSFYGGAHSVPTAGYTPTHYADPAASDGVGNGTSGSPWSWNDMVTNLASGMVVECAAGTFTKASTASTTPAFLIDNIDGVSPDDIVVYAVNQASTTARSTPALRTVFETTGATQDGTSGCTTLGLHNCDYITLDGFYIDSNNAPARPDRGVVSVLSNFSGAGTSTGCKVLGFNINLATVSSWVDNYPCIRIQYYAGTGGGGMADVEVANNLCTSDTLGTAEPVAIQSYASINLEVHHNEIRTYYGICLKNNYALGYYVVQPFSIHHNYCDCDRWGIWIFSPDGGASAYGDIYQNISIATSHAPMKIEASFVNNLPTRLRVVNNTFYCTGTHGEGEFIYMPNGDPQTGLIQGCLFQNNITRLNGNHAYVGWSPYATSPFDTQNTFAHNNDYNGGTNVFYQAGTEISMATWQASTETTATTDNPLFTNPAGGDFTLQGGSPCLNGGIDVLNLLGGGTSAPINKGAYILPGQTDVIGIAA